MHAVDVLRVKEVRAADGPGQPVLRLRHRDEVHVVRHQAVAEYFNTFGFARLPQKLEILPPIVIDEKHVLAVVAALGDVVRAVRDDGAGNA